MRNRAASALRVRAAASEAIGRSAISTRKNPGLILRRSAPDGELICIIRERSPDQACLRRLKARPQLFPTLGFRIFFLRPLLRLICLMIIAAIRSGTDPTAPLPPATFHRWLEEPLYCPKCEAAYNLVLDYDQAISRHFLNDSRRHFQMLRKAITLGHATGHHISHFETNGVVVIPHAAPKAGPTISIQPLTHRIQ